MTGIFNNEEDIKFTIVLSGSYEDYRIDEIVMLDPDGVEWLFYDNDGLLKGILHDDDIEELAYENAYDMELEVYLNKADALHDMMKEEGL